MPLLRSASVELRTISRTSGWFEPEKLGGDAVTEKTVRRLSVSRRTMLAGTAGVLGGAALASTARSDRCSCGPGRHRHRPAAIALRRSCMAGEAQGGDPRAGARDCRSASSFVGSQRVPLSARPAARRYRQRSQHHSQRLCRMRLNVPGRRPDRAEAGRRNRIRQRHRR